MGDVKLELVELEEESRSGASTRADADARPRFRRGRIAWVAAGALATALVAGWTLWRSRSSSPPPTLVQLSSERWAVAGSFSPDGSQIAYASPGEDGLNWDIWLKIVGQPNVRRLTTDPTAEHYPAWSPDGTQIAFLRYGEIRTRGQAVSLFATGQVYLMSALGGSARRMTDLPAWLQLSWSPDGTWLAAAKARTASDPPGGIHIISVARGEAHAVTFPKPPGFDHSPSFSPDGRSLAYASCGGPPGAPACSVYVLSLDADQRPQATAGPLTRQRQQIRGLTWSRDGRSIVYSSGSPADAGRGLFRVQARGGTPPERIALGRHGEFPSLGGNPERLAFARVSSERDIYRWRFGEGAAGLIQSTLWETHPQYSPDGRRIAFESNRTDGGTEIWLADADGSNPTRLTRGPGNYQGSPGWSPDGRSIVFDSRAENSQVDIWTVSSDGTGLRQVTRGPTDAIVPSYSRDGRFIYFSSNRRGRSEIFRVAGSGGREEQVTSAGGIQPFESRDGQTLYYLRDRSGRSPVLARPTRGGEERTILSCASLFNYAVASKGILHVACDSAGPGRFALLDWDAGTGRDRLIATLDADFVQGLSVSPDGQSVLYMRGTESSDLMMIENFR
jgi:Tol biopolymer transport system component